jgi:hypothetical protein
VASYIGITEREALDEFRKAVNGRRPEMAPAAVAPLSANEKLLLRLLLANPDAPDALLPGLQEAAALRQVPTRRIFETIFSLHGAGERIGFNDVHDRLTEDDRALLSAAVLLQESEGAGLSVEQGIACLRSLQTADIETKRAELKARVKEAERAGNLAEALRLSEELNRVRRTYQAEK